MSKSPDFSGWATVNDLQCADGRIIRQDAFKANDGKKVPLVWMHQHKDPTAVLGHAILHNNPKGMRADCFFNETDKGVHAKSCVVHGDVCGLSIWANELEQSGPNVVHGNIRELSLVLAGANPGAFIDSIMAHGLDCDDEAYIATIVEDSIQIEHAATDEKKEEGESKMAEETKAEEQKPEETKPESEETIGDVWNTLSEKQKNVVYAMIGEALAEKETSSEEDNKEMKHNVFDTENTDDTTVISHADMEAVINDARQNGSLKQACLAHGLNNIDYLYPEDHNLNTPPEFIKRDTGWVSTVMGGVHHTPFARIKSMFADITGDEARAKGYIKGNLKLEEVFGLLKRSTSPTTIYKKQSMHRDDIIDITDFDVVSWLKGEMRVMLDEEIARAILIGDGRSSVSEDKISEDCIRPIWTDADLYTIHKTFTAGDTDDATAKAFIKAAVKARKDYKGSGNTTLFTTEDMLINMLLIEDTQGYRIYKTEQELCSAMRVKNIVTVPVMENQTRTVTVSGTSKTNTLYGIIVNLTDYNVGADKGGAVAMFDDFDIDYNKQKYLIETRCSGALIKPYSAIVLETSVNA